MKKHLLFYVTIGAVLLALGACSLEVEGPAENLTGEDIPLRHLIWCGSRYDFDATATRATTDLWADGDKLYIRFYTPWGPMNGSATYHAKDDQWSLSVPDELRGNWIKACDLFYFENTARWVATNPLVLTPQSIAYIDTTSYYQIRRDTLELHANLQPRTGRIRFKGSPGTQVSVYGLRWFDAFFYDDYKLLFSDIDAPCSVTIEENGYSPYFYAVCSSKYTLTIPIDSTYAFQRSLDRNVLRQGSSGHISVPTDDNRHGWSVVMWKQPTSE